MKKHARLAMAFGALTVALSSTSLVVVGCNGDDDGVDLGDSGGGGLPDATSGDGDTFADVGTGDVANGEAGDGATNDAQADVDAGPPLDAGPPDPTMFAHQINVLTCQLLASCCTGSPSSTTFDFAHCEELFDNQAEQVAPGLAGNKLFAPSLDGGRVQFDPAMAQQCFADIRALGCGATSSDALLKLTADCNAAVKGTVDGGGSCAGSAECVPPLHCQRVGDAGLGTCAAALPTNAGCGPGFALEGVAQCGSRLSGPGYCANGLTLNGSQTCQPQLPLDAGCYVAYECASGICGDTTDPALVDAGAGACGSSIVVADPSTCMQYIKDAGHD